MQKSFFRILVLVLLVVLIFPPFVFAMSHDAQIPQEQRKYIGQEYDSETEFSYLNARYYDPARGQFMSQDPVFWEIGQTEDGKKALSDPQSQNSYSYSRNNPITNKDPQGRYWETAFDLAMFSMSLNDFREKPSFWNGVSAIADGASLALPIPAILGGLQHGDDALKFLKGGDKAGDVGRGIKNIHNVTVRNFEKVIYKGNIDLSDTIRGISDGIITPRVDRFGNPKLFKNIENFPGLDFSKGNKYYEYNVINSGAPKNTAERVIRGTVKGDVHYSPDHYKTLRKLIEK